MSEAMEQLKRAGWAAGNYSCTCDQCGAHHIADKRAGKCLYCAHSTALAAERERVRVLTEAMARIAKQKTTAEMEDEVALDADYEGGYHGCIEEARAAIRAEQS